MSYRPVLQGPVTFSTGSANKLEFSDISSNAFGRQMDEQSEEQDPKGSTEFWSTLWSEPVEHNRDSEWLKKVKVKLRDTPRQENVIIIAKELRRVIEGMFNWKEAGLDHVQGFFVQGRTSTHHERQRDSCRKLQTNFLPSTDVETVNKYIFHKKCIEI